MTGDLLTVSAHAVATAIVATGVLVFLAALAALSWWVAGIITKRLGYTRALVLFLVDRRYARLDAADPRRFRRLVLRIAAWTDDELAVVSPAQVRHVAQVVLNGADPTYPPFAPIGEAEA